MPIVKLTGHPWLEPLVQTALEPGGKLRQTGLVAGVWQRFLTGVTDRVERATTRIQSLRLQAQGGAIGATAFELPTLAAGLY